MTKNPERRTDFPGEGDGDFQRRLAFPTPRGRQNMIGQLIRHRTILLNLIFWELKRQYRGPRLGFLWVLFKYLVLVAIYTFIFSYVFGIEIPGFERKSGFAFYLLTGLLPWLTFQEAALRATQSLREHAGIIRNIIFPVDLIPVYQVCVGLIHMLTGFAILLALLLLAGYPLGVNLLLLPLPVGLQLMISVGLGWILAALTLKYNDLAYLV